MFMQGFEPIQSFDARHKELLHEAQGYYLIHQGLEGTACRQPILAKTLAHLGRYLAGWGANLEKRYSSAPINDCQAQAIETNDLKMRFS
jgi:hypothetical protein